MSGCRCGALHLQPRACGHAAAWRTNPCHACMAAAASVQVGVGQRWSVVCTLVTGICGDAGGAYWTAALGQQPLLAANGAILTGRPE